MSSRLWNSLWSPGRALLCLTGAWLCLAAAAPQATGTGVTATAEGFVVIVRADNPSSVIDREALSQIFLKRTTTWPDGVHAEPVDLVSSDAARAAFTKAVLRKSMGAVRAFWQQQIYSGRDIPPPEKNSGAEVIAFVAAHPGAVGYVAAATSLGDGVKAISLTEGSP